MAQSYSAISLLRSCVFFLNLLFKRMTMDKKVNVSRRVYVVSVISTVLFYLSILIFLSGVSIVFFKINDFLVVGRSLIFISPIIFFLSEMWAFKVFQRHNIENKSKLNNSIKLLSKIYYE